MLKPLSPSCPPACNALRSRAAFTLIEVLVAMVILVLIVVMYVQVIGGATSSIQHSTKGMDSAQAALITLDRIGNSIKGMVTTGSGTLVLIKNPGTSSSASDGLVMVTNGRVRSRTAQTTQNIDVNVSTNIRLGTRGYCVFNTADPDTPNLSVKPMLNWGDGTTTFVPPSGTTAYVAADPHDALMGASMDVSNQMSGNAIPPTTLQFMPVSAGIFRFEVCFLLSDGTVASGFAGPNSKPLTLLGFNGQPSVGTTLLPRNKNFVPNEAFGTNPPAQFPPPSSSSSYQMFPIAFNAVDSDAAPNANSSGANIYVRAVIVGIAGLDINTQKLLTSTQMTSLAGTDILPKAGAQTPLDAWDISSPASVSAAAIRAKLSPPNFPPAVLQNIRVFQRYFYVN